MSETQLKFYHELECPVMSYDWGVDNTDSLITQLSKTSDSILKFDSSKPISELWIGAHRKSSAKIIDSENRTSNISLRQSIVENPEHFLGTDLARANIQQLPFLFKLLEAAKPLSIQAHPDKQLAHTLHKKDPYNYPDSNHKPELAVCLQNMQALIGFRRPGQIYTFLNTIPELAALCSRKGGLYEEYHPPRPELLTRHQKRNWIKHHYGNLMRSTSSEIKEAVGAYRFHLQSMVGTPKRIEDNLFLQLTELYGDLDPGVFSIYFLNYVEMNAGQALFLGPNEPHAYLKGQIIECMAASDNVVRAGLTSKFKDTETLLGMLHYNFGPAPIQNPGKNSQTTGVCCYNYRIPVPDFELYKIEMEPGSKLQILGTDRPSIFLVLEGSPQLIAENQSVSQQVRDWHPGSIFMTPGDLLQSNTTISLVNPDSGTKVSIFRATVGQAFR